jgi:hypothetical protein
MRSQEKKQTSMLVLRSPEDFVPKQHQIRRIKQMADDILQSLSPTLEAQRRLRHRRAHHSPSGLHHQPAHPKARRRDLRLGQDRGQLRKTRLVGLAKNNLAGFMVGAAYNLVRLAKLLPLPEPA